MKQEEVREPYKAHISNYIVAFAMYIHVQYNNRVNGIIFNISKLFNPVNFLNSKKIVAKHTAT